MQKQFRGFLSKHKRILKPREETKNGNHKFDYKKWAAELKCKDNIDE